MRRVAYANRFLTCWAGFGLSLLLACGIVAAQPSGGPYGPVRQVYEIPKVKGRIYFVAPDGKAENGGESIDRPTTLEAAVEHARTGDAIVLRGGVYRTGNLVFNQGILFQPYRDEKPVLKGTFVAREWKALGNGLWKTKWQRLFPARPADWWLRDREGKKTPLVRFNNDMVFVNGRFLQAVGWEGEVNADTYYIDYESGEVYIGIDPSDKLVEITAYDVAFLRTTKEVHGKKPDRRGPIIRGITFTQYAYRALEIEGAFPEGLADESVFGKDVVGTVLENCTISFCSRVAAYLRGDSLVVRNCRISDTSTEGLYIMSSNDVLLERNIFARNNIERITGYYPAAVKIFNQCHRVMCRDNLVIDQPFSNGIWYDVGNVDGYFLNNWVEGVGGGMRPFETDPPWRNEAGFFFEISKGALCAGNVFVNCRLGVHVLNSSDVTIANNTFVNSPVCIARTERSATNDRFGWHASTGPDVEHRVGHVLVNNLLWAAPDFEPPLLVVWQSPALCGRLTAPQLVRMDHNVYIRSSEEQGAPLILFGPEGTENCQRSYGSLAQFREQHGEFEARGAYLLGYDGPLFKSPELGDYRMLEAFPWGRSGTRLRFRVGSFGPYVGAYPPGQ